MRNTVIKLISVGCLALVAVLCCVEPSRAQLRVPPTHVAALASPANEEIAAQQSETISVTTQRAAEMVPIQHIMQPQISVNVPQQTQPIASPSDGSQMQMQPQVQMVPQMQPQIQVVVPQQALAGSMTGGPIIIPVTVPQYMTYNPQPVTMMVNRPAQLVIPQYPAPMMQPMYDPMAMQMMQQPMMQPQAPPQQPIPIKMIMPDGSTVSIKHYVPGNFFKNVWRAVTP